MFRIMIQYNFSRKRLKLEFKALISAKISVFVEKCIETHLKYSQTGPFFEGFYIENG
jgi:hypothetical protein